YAGACRTRAAAGGTRAGPAPPHGCRRCRARRCPRRRRGPHHPPARPKGLLSMEITRRQLLAGAAVGATAAATGTAVARPAARPAATLPDPASSGLDHIVFVCMENRSFDHYLGWLP